MTGWKHTEAASLAAAVSRAPSAGDDRPWRLEFRDREASISERPETGSPRSESAARDRVISCGAAVTNLRVAVRGIGWTEGWLAFPDPDHPEELARVIAGRRHEPDDADLAAYRAIRARVVERGFSGGPVPAALVEELLAVPGLPGVGLHPVRGAEVAALARLVGRSGEPGLEEEQAVERLAGGTHLVLTTVSDERADHLHSGMVLEEVWLAAVAAGFGVSAATRPLHSGGDRVEFAERLESGGYPQVLLRVGVLV